jgi:hypothetical protein
MKLLNALFGGLFVMAVIMAASAEAIAQSPTPDEVKELAQQLHEEAAAWVDGAAPDEEELLINKIEKMTYDAEAAQAAILMATGCRADEAGAYVAARLLLPLRKADADMAKLMLARVRQVYARHQFRKPRQYSKNAVGHLSYPEYKPGDNAQAMLARIDAIHKQREQKISMDAPIRRYNLQTGEIEQTYLVLAIRSGQADAQILKMIQKSFADRTLTWFHIIETLKEEVEHLSPERAKDFYEKLIAFGDAQLTVSDWTHYNDPRDVKIAADDNSEWNPTRKDFTYEMWTAANVMAEKAGTQKISVPGIYGGGMRQLRKKAQDAQKSRTPFKIR